MSRNDTSRNVRFDSSRFDSKVRGSEVRFGSKVRFGGSIGRLASEVPLGLQFRFDSDVTPEQFLFLRPYLSLKPSFSLF